MLSMVYYDAATDKVHSMNAEWNTVRGETEPASIPGGIDMSDPVGLTGNDPSGRTVLVGGFMKGVGAAHERFGSFNLRLDGGILRFKPVTDGRVGVTGIDVLVADLGHVMREALDRRLDWSKRRVRMGGVDFFLC